MVEIGGRPILWHIMSYYASFGHNNFLVACGYKGEMIKEYFRSMAVRESDFVVNLRDGSLRMLNESRHDWQVGLIDTGLDTMTGGRVRRLQGQVNDSTFMCTYGDGLCDVDVGALLAFHKQHGKLATVTAVRPPARFGGLTMQGDAVTTFSEKPQAEGGWINGGYFVFEPGVFEYLGGDDCILEREPLERLAARGELQAFRHAGFFQPMDTLRERTILEGLWNSGQAPWKRWT